MVAPWPAELGQSRVWCRDRGWRELPQLFGQYARRPSVTWSLTCRPRSWSRLRFLLTACRPPQPWPADDAPATARRAVAAVVRELNDLVAPMISQLEQATPAR